ncbi:MAG: glycosyltransferase [Deltaproteobacteria bacterium]|nr:glycosyltransferase [Deltaproteobacteria bacterium]
MSGCIKSVINVVKHNSLKEYEILYVDSKSTDDSLNVVRKFQNVKIIRLLGDYNAAIARNVGAFESKGDILFFIDGDMEINPFFLRLVYSDSGGLKFNFVSGQFIDIEYNNGKVKKEKKYHQINGKLKKQYTTGGLFIIRREVWEYVGGMRNKLRRNQDIDLGIRLANKGFLLVRINEILAYHHTVSYRNPKRMFRLIFNGDDLFRCVLLRDNLLNKYQWLYFLRENYTMFMLLLLFIFTVFTGKYYFLFAYILALIIRVLRKKGESLINRVLIYIYYVIRDVAVFIGLFFFWPSEPKNIKFEKNR